MSLFSIDYRGTSLSLEIFIMTDTVFNPAVQPIPIPVRELLPWIIFGGLILVLALYFIGAEQGAAALIPVMYVHEFVHASRHLLGFPCHCLRMNHDRQAASARRVGWRPRRAAHLWLREN